MKFSSGQQVIYIFSPKSHVAMKPVLIVIDMLNDFVFGALSNPTNNAIIPNIKRLLL